MIAGRLADFIDAWKEITTDKFIIDCINGYKIPFDKTPSQNTFQDEPNWNLEESLNIKNEINKLLSKGAIEECEENANQFISPYFLASKPDGSYRFILNLKKLNEFITPIHFKMEDLRTARNIMPKKAYMTSVDLQDAYFLIKVEQNSRKFLRFKFKGHLYQFKCLPFGLCTSPFVFTKIMKPVLNTLRSEGILSVIYLDDLLLIEKDFQMCKNNVNEAINLLKSLGFIINYKKSSLIPNQKCQFLGFILNSKDFTIELTTKKKKQVSDLLKYFTVGRKVTIRQFAHLLGVLVACCPAVAYGMMHCRRLERLKFLELLINNDNYEKKMTINETIKDDLIWWKENAALGVNPIRTMKFNAKINSDASLSGWGAFSEGIRIGGFWNPGEKEHHINYLELLASFLALKSFARNLTNCEILLRIDNTTAISYINKMGGVRFPHLNNLARSIWEWCEKRKIWLFASYIPSKENVEADAASRNKNIDTEWELAPKAFKQISKKFGPFSIDLFASAGNTKCSIFCSRFPDPKATFVDAFTISWSKKKFYAFPPFALIAPTLKKIILDKASGTLIVPFWPAQPWYPLLMSLICEPPLFFKPQKDLLLSPCRKVMHPIHASLFLVAVNLSGKRFEKRKYLKTPWTSLQTQ